MIGDVRGIGLMLAVELVTDRETKARFPKEFDLAGRLAAKFREAGLILRPGGNVISISPPLCITRPDVDEILSVLDRVIGEIEVEI